MTGCAGKGRYTCAAGPNEGRCPRPALLPSYGQSYLRRSLVRVRFAFPAMSNISLATVRAVRRLRCSNSHLAVKDDRRRCSQSVREANRLSNRCDENGALKGALLLWPWSNPQVCCRQLPQQVKRGRRESWLRC